MIRHSKLSGCRCMGMPGVDTEEDEDSGGVERSCCGCCPTPAVGFHFMSIPYPGQSRLREPHLRQAGTVRSHRILLRRQLRQSELSARELGHRLRCLVTFVRRGAHRLFSANLVGANPLLDLARRRVQAQALQPLCRLATRVSYITKHKPHLGR